MQYGQRLAVYRAASILESMVIPSGFEPLAPRLGIWCSIQLSYGTITLANSTGFNANESPRQRRKVKVKDLRQTRHPIGKFT